MEESNLRVFLLTFLTYIILLNTLIPISLIVTIEIVKFIQGIFMAYDKDMMVDKNDEL